MLRRRPLLLAPALFALAGPARALPPRTLQFPRDHGAHPALRTEWWYITGALQAGGGDYGFQVTFFRTRVDGTQALASRFAARQLIFAHVAVTDVAAGRLLHDQRIAREGMGIAFAATEDTQVRLRDWQLAREGGGAYHARLAAERFGLDLRCAPTQPLLLQGAGGLSRKGPEPRQASYYYSQPQLAVTGTLSLAGRPLSATGRAWLDHEFSEEVMHPQAVGWDWIGMNLDDGSALTAFRLRRADGSTLWDGGSFRAPGQPARIFAAGETRFAPLRHWTSPMSGTRYPVEWEVRTPAGSFRVQAVVDAQELDSRTSTGAIYWEGLSALRDTDGRVVGRGYLEMTGYAQRLRL